jgi:hypothetical protein
LASSVAIALTASSNWMDSAISRGASSSTRTRRCSSAASILPRDRAAATASAVKTLIWAVKALVEATPISGPQWIGQTTSTSRAMVDSWALTTAALCIPLAWQKRRAASVSAVSPDCDMAMTRELELSAGWR